MADRTGMAHGTLRPCIYFSRRTDLYAMLAPCEVGGGVELARMVYETRFKRDWMWCEATTLHEVDRLQKRLVNQELFEAQKKIQVNDMMRERVFRRTGDALRNQMVSAATSQFERDWIREYLRMRDDKRDKYRDSLLHRNQFIMAREMDSTRKPDELLPLQEGQYERTPEGGTPLDIVKRVEEHNAMVAARGLA
jgi:hypothetical protein